MSVSEPPRTERRDGFLGVDALCAAVEYKEASDERREFSIKKNVSRTL